MLSNLVKLLETERKLWIESDNANVEITLPDGCVYIHKPIYGAITPESILGFSVDSSTGELTMISNCQGGSRKIVFGLVEDYESALDWLNKANRCYVSPPKLNDGSQGTWDWSKIEG